MKYLFSRLRVLVVFDQMSLCLIKHLKLGYLMKNKFKKNFETGQHFEMLRVQKEMTTIIMR